VTLVAVTLGGKEAAIPVYDDIVTRFGDATEPSLREEVARALSMKGAALAVLGRNEAAIAVYDDLVARFGDAEEPSLRQRISKALAEKARWAQRQPGGNRRL
jgi:hypothetical protein